MRIKGERIVIRDLTLKDAKDFYEYSKHQLVGPNAGWKPIESENIANRVLSGMILSRETFAIALSESNKLIGTISLYSNTIRKWKSANSIGFSLNYDYWGLGYATEALKLMIRYVFTKTECELIEIGHHLDNNASRRVIEKCGFKLNGLFPKYKKLYDGKFVDAVLYSLEKEEYERMIENE
jgi:RimJ/RimL family protein N-acetyltransferase